MPVLQVCGGVGVVLWGGCDLIIRVEVRVLSRLSKEMVSGAEWRFDRFLTSVSKGQTFDLGAVFGGAVGVKWGFEGFFGCEDF